MGKSQNEKEKELSDEIMWRKHEIRIEANNVRKLKREMFCAGEIKKLKGENYADNG